VPRLSITRLEIAAGRRRHWDADPIIGAAAGVALVAAAAAIPKDEFCSPGEPTTQRCRDDRSALLAIGIPGLALEGTAIGTLVKTDRWVPVPPQNVRLGFAPAGGHGLGLSLAVRSRPWGS
jgi:hypothetical protein